jgi:thymidylate synthase
MLRFQACKKRRSTKPDTATTINDNTHDEYQYLNLIQDILQTGSLEIGRNGSALTVFGSAMHFDLRNGTLPLLTTKRIAWKTCFKELLWFIKGSTDNNELVKQNVHIWTANASGLPHLDEGDLGPIYGHQWRHFNAPYTNCQADYTGQGVDQLAYIIQELRNPLTRNSRRLVMSAWNPAQIAEMALPPCHILAQFNVVEGDKLACSLYQRSGDVGLGVPFNIASYALLTHLIAFHCGLQATEFMYHLGNCHIYDDHIEVLSKQVEKEPLPFPTLTFKTVKARIEDYTLDDLKLYDYISREPLKMEMRK